jgi:hypothetical protein
MKELKQSFNQRSKKSKRIHTYELSVECTLQLR